MALLRKLVWDRSATAAAEMALVAPLLLIILFGSVELGNYFLNEHAVSKAVRDGARYGSRLTLSGAYDCPTNVFEDSDYETHIKNVTTTGSVDGTATGRFPSEFWTDACPGGTAVGVEIRCVAEGSYSGVYASLDGDAPVVKVTANLRYPSVLGTLGLDTSGLCLRAESEAAVIGI